ncbi:hypothetical protein IEZ26_09535 [Nocardioides cavernae]|uniref:Uncharacterized protein n=1 Tax=Nocardioides cavernae TaxID=1921566 RepID=A0ABR8N9P1_9ACTN|nr:hypothetical protein [Nocardioides cavernae]MBD3924858.1 hypothetical protein [Nocardioides cavernae]MBM7514768.1 hypothetical protein [Nocardioides cavernae]
MSFQTEGRAPVWPPASRLVPTAFVVQASVSLVAWFLVDDRSRGGAWSSTDFEEWALLSVLGAALLVMLFSLVRRRWSAAAAVAAGCSLAIISGCAVFAAYAVLNSA